MSNNSNVFQWEITKTSWCTLVKIPKFRIWWLQHTHQMLGQRHIYHCVRSPLLLMTVCNHLMMMQPTHGYTYIPSKRLRVYNNLDVSFNQRTRLKRGLICPHTWFNSHLVHLRWAWVQFFCIESMYGFLFMSLYTIKERKLFHFNL